MRFKILVASILLLGFASSSLAAQPKILSVNDNLGHSCEFDSIPDDYETAEYDWGSCSITDQSISMDVNEEVVVTDDTEIGHCINKVEKEEGDNLLYRSDFGYEDHPSDIKGWTDSRCNSWELDTNDYTKRWFFRWHMKNEDDIAYQNPSVGSDFRVDINYRNLTLESASSDTQIMEYDTVTISRDEYENLKSKRQELNETQETVENKEEKINQLNNEIGNKESKIRNLSQQIEQKESSIREMNSTINGLNDRVEELESKLKNLEGGFLSGILSLF